MIFTLSSFKYGFLLLLQLDKIWYFQRFRQAEAGTRSVFVVQNQMQVEPGPGECCKCVPVPASMYAFYLQASFLKYHVYLPYIVTSTSRLWVVFYMIPCSWKYACQMMEWPVILGLAVCFGLRPFLFIFYFFHNTKNYLLCPCLGVERMWAWLSSPRLSPGWLQSRHWYAINHFMMFYW